MRWCLVVCVVFIASCSGAKPFPDDALSVLRSAGKRSASSVGAVVAGTMYNTLGPVIRLDGFVNLRDRTLSVRTSSALPSLSYPPFESRAVDGWSYVEIDSTVSRPAALRKNVNWVAFRGRPGLLPIPVETLDTTFLFEFFDHLTATQISQAEYVGPSGVRGRQIRFGLPALDPIVATSEYTVTIRQDGRIDEIESSRVGANGPNSDLTLTWTTALPAITAPPSDEVQILTPGENLYPSTTTTTTTLPAPGAIDESDAIAGNKGLFDADRTQIEASLRVQSDPKLTAFSFDTTTNTVSAAFAYEHPAPANRARYDAFAWSVAKNLADTFWSTELVQAIEGQHVNPAWLPKLHIQLDDVSYACASAVQIAVGAHTISQHDWLRRCAA
jgi:hypothetical protein